MIRKTHVSCRKAVVQAYILRKFQVSTGEHKRREITFDLRTVTMVILNLKNVNDVIFSIFDSSWF